MVKVTPDQYTGSTELVHLHNHTVFSTLDGVMTPEQAAEACKERGYPAMSATEHGNMASVPDMYTAFKKQGVKFIAGCEIYYNDLHPHAITRRDGGFTAQKAYASDDPADWEEYLACYRSRHLTVLAKNEVGYHNLIKLTTDANRYGTWRANRPGRVWFNKLCEYKEGLIILSGCLNGPVAHELRRRRAIKVQTPPSQKSKGKSYWRVKDKGDLLPRSQRFGAAIEIVKKFREAFGKNYWMEAQMPVIKDEDPNSPFKQDDFLIDLQVFRDQIIIADRAGIDVVVTNDAHYLREEDHILQRLMMAIEQDVQYNSPELFASNSSQQYLKTRAELWATFRNHQYCLGLDDGVFERMCDNTLKLADQCKPLKIDTSPKIPVWKNADEELRKQVHLALHTRGYDRVQKRYSVDGKEVTYVEQAEIELDRFISKGFSSYFLITADLVRFGREQGYPFGPRGSAGGSLVCMLLGIHNLDPLKWRLSFDRFMSPSRGGFMLKVKMPDPIN